jgi:hypothetical protein
MTLFKTLFLSFVFFVFTGNSFSQENGSNSDKKAKRDKNDPAVPDSVFGHFVMVNSKDSSKYFKISDRVNYRIGYVQIPQDTITLNKIYDITGNIRDLGAKTIDFDVISETIEHNFKDSSIVNTHIDYSSFYYSKQEKPQTINLKSLRYLDYASPARSIAHISGMSLMIVGAFTSLILAPAFSIDYTNNNMDVKHYLTMAKIGLVGVAAGFPIYHFSKDRRYNLTNNRKKNDRDFWYLVKEDE